MAGFFHFLPCEKEGLVEGKRVRLEVLREYGLGDVLADCEHAPDDLVIVETPEGPSGSRGATLYPKNPTAPSPTGWGYNAPSQTWRNVGGGRWLGWETDNPPTPEDLQRKRVYRGYVAPIAGAEWLVPCARSARHMISVPIEYGYTAGGELERRPAAAFAWLWELSGDVLDELNGRTDRGDEWSVAAALRVLGVNYRIGPAEATALRDLGTPVLTNQSVMEILAALIDQDLEQEGAETLLKKTTTETEATTETNSGNGRPPRPCSSVSSGPGADSPDTARPEAASPSPL